MNRRALVAACVSSLVAAFGIDLVTPQLFVAAILLDVPIVLASLGGDRRFTYALVGAALVANVVAGYFNGLRDGAHWDAVGLADRGLAALSIVLVGYLSSVAQDTGRQAGRAAAREARARREGRVAAAAGRLHERLSPALVTRAIAAEALDLFNASEARFIPVPAERETLVAHPGGVDAEAVRPPPEIISFVQRALDEDDALAAQPSDALGRLLLAAPDTPALVALPIADGGGRFGALVVRLRTSEGLEEVLPSARAYGRHAAGALAQARLFEQLSERNDALEERTEIIRDLVFAISHDLRTPLAALGVTLRQARAGAYGELPENYQEIVDRSIAATDETQRLADTLLLVARFESGERRPARERVALGEIARRIAGELDAIARVRKLTIAVHGGDGIETIADPGDVRRAITNLVANALAHTPEGGDVEIEVTQEGADAVVRVIDDG